MKPIPHDPAIDATLTLLSEGYLFISKRRENLESNIFQTRLMLQPVICMSGNEAAELFYDTQYFMRKGAAPKRIQKTLIGVGGVQSLDDDTHRRRKALFMSFMSVERIESLMQIFKEIWQRQLPIWQQAGEIILFDEMEWMLCQAACQWCGIALNEAECRKQGSDMSDMVDGFAGTGPRHWRARAARKRAEAWAARLIQQARQQPDAFGKESIVCAIAMHEETDGRMLEAQIAAVELLNLIRPITAIATYITFLALALYRFPQEAAHLKAGGAEERLYFVQEVRRFYPFTPFVGARARKAFDWREYHFPKGRLVLLDIYGMNHDATLWTAPEHFNPSRFAGREERCFDFMPQGGGHHASGHRCAGEWVTIALMQLALEHLTHMKYEVPLQDLSFTTSRIPTLPHSGFILKLHASAKRSA